MKRYFFVQGFGRNGCCLTTTNHHRPLHYWQQQRDTTNTAFIRPTTVTTTTNLFASNLQYHHDQPKQQPPIQLYIPIYYDSTNDYHRDIQYHPEQPERITACVNAIRHQYSTNNRMIQSGEQQKQQDNKSNPIQIRLVDVADTTTGTKDDDNDNDKNEIVSSDFGMTTTTTTVVETNLVEEQLSFTVEELLYAKHILMETHTNELVIQLEEISNNAKLKRIELGKNNTLGHMGYIDADTYVTTETFHVCLRAMATWIRAITKTKTTRNDNNNQNNSHSISNVRMALTRPPGHHATKTLQNGFCFFNFAAGAAIHCTKMIEEEEKEYNHHHNTTTTIQRIPKVSILDWDVHYGQGVTDIVRQSPYTDSIRYVSIHQVPAFPYEGQRYETPYSNIMTLPMPPDTTWTCGYETLFQKALQFLCHHDTYVPDYVIVCAGYDALSSDELANTNLIATDYYRMTTLLLQHLQTHCINNNKNNNNNNKFPIVLFGLEGGYQLNKDVGPCGNLPDAVVETIKGASDFLSSQQQQQQK